LFAVVVTTLEQGVNNLKHKGRTIRKVMGGGGKAKIEQGKQKIKKFVHQKSLKKETFQ
jgi:hypothetical protein